MQGDKNSRLLYIESYEAVQTLGGGQGMHISLPFLSKGFQIQTKGTIKGKTATEKPISKKRKGQRTVQLPQHKQKHQFDLLTCKLNGTASRVNILATKQTAFGRKAITYNTFYHLIVVMFVDDHERPPSRGGHTPPHTSSLGYKEKFHQTTR